ncbi:phosphatase PAP2 family protein [Alicyclobacillus acidiphilus]|uniref:phosphatase PAP2 family protein n=1 Tax=Alicyclobacillus acidiphilus TaxID=182455 RepID=UPI0008323120|nr:phosphatase PAP2 family protein [Alicyclobacillus acidiphilus]
MDVTEWLWDRAERMDAAITRAMQRLWQVSHLLNATMVIVAKYTPIFMLVTLVIASTGWLPVEANAAKAPWNVASSICAALLIRGIHEPISRLVSRPRPFDTEPFQPLLRHDPGESFPSNHAAGGFALAMGAVHLPGYFPILLCLAIVLACSRTYCGLHHATDVVIGSLGGIGTGLVVASFARCLGFV